MKKILYCVIAIAVVAFSIGCGHPTDKFAISPRGEIAYNVTSPGRDLFPGYSGARIVISNKFGEVEKVIDGAYWPDFNNEGELVYLKGDIDNNNIFVLWKKPSDEYTEKNMTGTKDVTYGTPSWSPNGKTILFVSNRDKETMKVEGEEDFKTKSHEKNEESLESYLEIYTLYRKTKEIHRLTNNLIPDGFPVYSPDGKHIASLTFEKRKVPMDSMDETAFIKLQVMDDDGSNQKIVSNPGVDLFAIYTTADCDYLDRLFSWHKDYLVYTSFEKSLPYIDFLYLYEKGGASDLELVERAVQFVSNVEIARHDVATGKANYLTDNNVPDAGAIIYGDTIAYTSVDEKEWRDFQKQLIRRIKEDEDDVKPNSYPYWGGICATYTMDIDGHNVKRISRTDEGAFPLAWMPDGRLVMLVCDKFNFTYDYELKGEFLPGARIVIQNLQTGERTDITTPNNIQLRSIDAMSKLESRILKGDKEQGKEKEFAE